jgi:hypothetical protein
MISYRGGKPNAQIDEPAFLNTLDTNQYIEIKGKIEDADISIMLLAPESKYDKRANLITMLQNNKKRLVF